jgi:Tfp pilus assembly protein PilN
MIINFNYSGKPFEDINKYYRTAIILGVLVLLMIVLNAYFYLDYRKVSSELIPERDFLEKKRDNLELQLSRDSEELKRNENKALFKKIDELNELIESRIFSWTRLLDALENTIPPDVMVTSINPKISGNGVLITISVKTYDYRGILKLITNMDASTSFSDLYPVFENTENKGGRKEVSADFVFKYNPHKEKEKPLEVPDEE